MTTLTVVVRTTLPQDEARARTVLHEAMRAYVDLIEQMEGTVEVSTPEVEAS